MIERIEREHVTEVEVHRFVTEASTLRLFPGEVWPSYIPTSLGNKQPMRLTFTDDERACYRQSNGCIDLVVMND